MVNFCYWHFSYKYILWNHNVRKIRWNKTTKSVQKWWFHQKIDLCKAKKISSSQIVLHFKTNVFYLNVSIWKNFRVKKLSSLFVAKKKQFFEPKKSIFLKLQKQIFRVKKWLRAETNFSSQNGFEQKKYFWSRGDHRGKKKIEKAWMDIVEYVETGRASILPFLGLDLFM